MMSLDPFGDDLTETENCIVTTYDRNPDITAKGIADTCNCSANYVRQTLNEYRPNWKSDGLF